MTVAAPAPPGTADALAIGDLELTGPLAPIALDDGVAGVRLLLRLHGEPVARLTIPSRDGSAAIAPAVRRELHGGRLDGVVDALARRAATSAPPARHAVEALWEGNGSPPPVRPPSLTVAICTRDRPAGVDRLLASLAPAMAEGADVLVVDNAPRTGATHDLVARAAGVRYLHEPAPGLDRARNRALEGATGDVVAFADDDVVVDTGWCAAVRDRFARDPELTLLTGLVEPLALASEAERWFEAYGGFGRGYGPRWVHAPDADTRAIAFPLANTGRFGTGANLALRRGAAFRLGGFDPALDVGTATRGGGDLEMMFRVLKGGGVLGYTNSALVRHAHRRTWDELASQIESWGSGMAAHLARTVRAQPDERLAVAALRRWLEVTWFAKRWATSYVRAPFPRALIRRELIGSRRGAALYEESSRGHPAPSAANALHGPSAARRRGQSGVEAGRLHEPLAFAHDGRVAIRVRLRGASLGMLDMETCAGTIGATRLRDAVAAQWGRALLGDDVPGVRRRVAALLARAEGR